MLEAKNTVGGWFWRCLLCLRPARGWVLPWAQGEDWKSWSQSWRLIIGANNSDYFIYVYRIKTLTVELKTKQEEMKTVKADLQYFQEEKEAAYKQSQVLRWEPEKKCWCWKCSISYVYIVYKDSP